MHPTKTTEENKMIKDIGKAAYWIVVFLVAFILVALGVNVIFSAAGVFLAVIFAPMLLTKAAASGAEVEAPKAESKSDSSNAVKFHMVK